MLVEKLLFSHDIKPPYTNVDKWNVNNCKMLINIRYPTIIFMVYQREKVNYMNNKNALTFMAVEEGLEVYCPYIMFNNLCNELNRWTKM
jgi:hypothetical protein